MTLQNADRRDVALRAARKNQHTGVARRHKDLIMRDVNFYVLGRIELSVRALDDTNRRRLAIRPAPVSQDRLGELLRHGEFIANRIVNDAVHRPAKHAALAFNLSNRFGSPFRQPGENRDLRMRHSIRNKQLLALRVESDRMRVPHARNGVTCFGAANHS